MVLEDPGPHRSPRPLGPKRWQVQDFWPFLRNYQEVRQTSLRQR